MKFHIITTQPNIFDSFLNTGLIARGQSLGIIEIKVHSLYDFASDKHRSIDDSPYGGGPGMIIRVDVIDKALRSISKKKAKKILLDPQGQKFDHQLAKKMAKEKEIILISGRFEGFDERVRTLADEEISIGDYVLTSGDVPAMIVIDAISRHIPGFIKENESLKIESFENGLLEYPQYTRPLEYNGQKVPEILTSGNHQEVERWRLSESKKKTLKKVNSTERNI